MPVLQSLAFKSKECDNWLHHFEKFYQATSYRLARKSNENPCKLIGSVINFVVNKAAHIQRVNYFIHRQSY